MTTFMLSCHRRAYNFMFDRTAVAATEYALILGIIALIAIGAAATLGTNVADSVNDVGDMLGRSHFNVEH